MKRNRLEEEDIVEVKIRNISGTTGMGDALAKLSGPGHGPRHVHIDDKNHNIGDRVFVEITECHKSHYEAVVTDPPEKDEKAISYFENSRDERVEWEGTKQNIEASSDKSKKVFSEGDSTGDKNNLLGGHL